MILPPFTEVAGRELVFVAGFAGRLAVAVAIVVSRPSGNAKNAAFFASK